MEENKRQFQIHLPGLLKVLAENLYSTPKVAIRELLQNAHDSCVRRMVEAKIPTFKPRIDVATDLDTQTITIRDNGSGLTHDEIIEYLSTIGRSYTRQLGENLSIFEPEMSEKLIGQFGLGFLSAFLIASEITLTTRSMQSGSLSYKWHSQGDIHYHLTTADDSEIGTQVRLVIKPSASFLLNSSILAGVIQHYADFLPIPIYLNGSTIPVNAITPPWQMADPTTAIEEYITRKFEMTQPLAVISLHDHDIQLGHDTMTIPLRGFLFIPSTSTVSIQEYGDVSIYIRHMFICDNQRDLLPAWARFVRGVAESPVLEPTASREELRREEMFVLVQRALEQQLSTALRHLAQTDPKRWKQIVYSHRNIMMGWAAKNNDFFGHIASIIPFHTTRGQMVLPEYLQNTDNTIYYVTHDIELYQDEILGEALGMPILNASRFGEISFLQKYADYYPHVQLVRMDDGSGRFMHPTPAEPFQALLNYYTQRKIRVQLVTFKPEAIPAIMSYPKEAEFVRDARESLDRGEIPDAFAKMVGIYVNKITVDEEMLAVILYLNANNTCVQALTKVEKADVRESVLELIYHMARLLAGRMLDGQKITTLFESTTTELTRLIQ